MAPPIDSVPASPEDALQRLRSGNARFVSQSSALSASGWRTGLANGQLPLAVVVGCSDSRAPAELIFDQGLGDLFVVRLAGNIIAPSGIGSVEFAVSQFGTRLVVVVGHTHCGAVAATVTAIEQRDPPESKNIRAITDRIRPHVEKVVRRAERDGSLHANRAATLRQAVRSNIYASVDQLRHGSPLLEELRQAGQIAIVGAEYDLETGVVSFLEDGNGKAKPEGSAGSALHPTTGSTERGLRPTPP